MGWRARRVDLSAFALSLARRELRRMTTKHHKVVLHFREPFVLTIALLGVCCFILSIVLGLTASREVAPHHGAFL
jgi:CRISPR/Cas system-associated endoribonuclease Cas2